MRVLKVELVPGINRVKLPRTGTVMGLGYTDITSDRICMWVLDDDSLEYEWVATVISDEQTVSGCPTPVGSLPAQDGAAWHVFIELER